MIEHAFVLVMSPRSTRDGVQQAASDERREFVSKVPSPTFPSRGALTVILKHRLTTFLSKKRRSISWPISLQFSLMCVDEMITT